MQEGFSCVASLLLHADVEADDLGEHLLTLADVEKIKEIRNGLGVIGARATADYKGAILATVSGKEGNSRQIQHVENGGIAHFVLEGKAQEIKLTQRVTTLQRRERRTALQHLFLHIRPGSIGALAPDVLMGIQTMIEDAHAEIGHTDLIGIGESKGKARLDGGLVLDNLTEFSAGITSGTGNRAEEHSFLVLVHDNSFISW